jgi:hypothetical protein
LIICQSINFLLVFWCFLAWTNVANHQSSCPHHVYAMHIIGNEVSCLLNGLVHLNHLLRPTQGSAFCGPCNMRFRVCIKDHAIGCVKQCVAVDVLTEAVDQTLIRWFCKCINNTAWFNLWFNAL